MSVKSVEMIRAGAEVEKYKACHQAFDERIAMIASRDTSFRHMI